MYRIFLLSLLVLNGCHLVYTGGSDHYCERTSGCDMAFRALCQNQQKEALDQFEKAAKSGSLAARLFLVYLYGEGLNTEVSFEKAEKWMLVISTEMKGKNDQEKMHVYQDDFAWMQRLLQHKIERKEILGVVYNNIGYMYLRGWGTKKDLQKSFYYMNEAVRFGNVFAHYELGKMYEDGVVVERNFQKAYSLYKVAADRRNPFANYRLGIMCRDGLGVEKDESKSQEYLQKAGVVIEKMRSQALEKAS